MADMTKELIEEWRERFSEDNDDMWNLQEKAKLDALCNLALRGLETKVDYAYDPDNWEETRDIGEVSSIWDPTMENGPFRTALLAKLPDKWAARENHESCEFLLFDTEEQAQAHISSLGEPG